MEKMKAVQLKIKFSKSIKIVHCSLLGNAYFWNVLLDYFFTVPGKQVDID